MAEKEELEIVKGLLPAVGIGTAVVIGFAVLVRSFALGRRVYYQDGQYLVSVRYPRQLNDLRDFVQPDNPDVLAVYSQIGPDPWGLYDFVCRNIEYRRDIGEFWQTPSETLKGNGDCEDTSILLTSLIRAGGMPNCYVALGSLADYGHAWCFPGDTKIICIKDGRYKPIEIGNLQNFSGTEALSYNFRTKNFEHKPIIGFACQGVKPLVKVTLRGAPSIRCTPNHPFPVKWDNRYAVRQIDKIAEDRHCRKILIAKEIPALNALEIPNEQLALEGIFGAEGSTTCYQNTNYKKVRISNTDTSIVSTIIQNLNALRVSHGVYWQNDFRRGRKPCCHITIGRSHLKDTFSKMGSNHRNKHFLEDRLSSSKVQARIILDNFAKGDGYDFTRRQCIHKVRGYTTTSKQLAWQLAFLHRLLGERMYLEETNEYLKLGGRMDTYRKYNILPSLLGRELKDMGVDGQDEVYDIEVADNHNFVLADSFALTHNCQLAGQILETTYTSARPVPNPQDYCPYCMFNESEVKELWPGALGEVFELGRDEATKLNLMAEVASGFA